jgi:hypothetical protein
MVVIGALATDPGMILDFHRFRRDFLFNYIVTSSYGGGDTSPGYIRFLTNFADIFGVPGAVLIAALLIGSIVLLAARRPAAAQVQGWLLALSVFLLYFLKFGSLHRAELRFSLPCAPLLLLLAGPAVQALAEGAWRLALLGLAIPVFGYSAVCSYWVGSCFAGDPRNRACDWLLRRIGERTGQVVEASVQSPHWYVWRALGLTRVYADEWNARDTAKLAGKSLEVVMPDVENILMNRLFRKAYAGNAAVAESTTQAGGNIELFNQCYTAKALAERNPDVIIYEGLIDWHSEPPAIADYYDKLMKGELGYRVVSDATVPDMPKWAYPRSIETITGMRIARPTPPPIRIMEIDAGELPDKA